MHQIILKPGAVLMIKDAYDWYEERSKGSVIYSWTNWINVIKNYETILLVVLK